LVQGLGLVGSGLPKPYRICLGDASVERAVRVLVAHTDELPISDEREFLEAVVRTLSTQFRCTGDALGF
jgi:hypothetical protein